MSIVTDPDLSFIFHVNISSDWRLLLFVCQKYVQDLLKEDAGNVCDLIIDSRAHVYVCGGAAMANDVSKTLQVTADLHSLLCGR